MSKATVCQVCEGKGKARRRRCPKCSKLVHACCWHVATAKCVGCYGDPGSRDEHLKRINERHATMVEAFNQYQFDCLTLWDADGPAPPIRDPSPAETWRLWWLAIYEAAEALGVSEESVTVPSEPWQDFPIAPEPGGEPGDYDIEALKGLVVLKGRRSG